MSTGLLLIHGFPLDSTMWTPQLEALPPTLPVLAPDLPGFGGDSSSLEVMTMGAAADSVVRAMDAIGMERALVCGLSMGGYVALAMWRHHRDRVAGLVLANTKASADDDVAKQRRRDVGARARSEGTAFLVEQPPPLFSPEAGDELWQWAKASIAQQPLGAVAAASLGMAERPDSFDLLSSIDVPVLVITSSKDTLIPPAESERMAGAIPGARLEVIDGAGHLSNLEARLAFNQLLLSFVEGVI